MRGIGAVRSRRTLLAVAVLLLLPVLAACAAGANDAAAVAGQNAAGFWLGLWHGLICPVTFLISLFTDSVSIYDVHNNGNWYDFGFVLGLSVVFGGPGRGAYRAAPARRRRRRDNARRGREDGTG